MKHCYLWYNVGNNKREVLNMRVYVQKENKNTMILGIFAIIIFLSFSVGIFIRFFKSEKSFVDELLSSGIDLLFAIVFLCFGLYFIYILIKRPRAYKVKLIDKKFETYKNNIYEV